MYLDLPSRHCIEFLKGTLGLKRSAPNWAVLRECAHEPLQFYWFRAAIRFYWLLSSNSATIKQALHVDLKLVPRAKTSWASDIMRDFEGLRGCGSYTQSFLQGLPICHSDFTADPGLLTSIKEKGPLGKKSPFTRKEKGGGQSGSGGLRADKPADLS